VSDWSATSAVVVVVSFVYFVAVGMLSSDDDNDWRPSQPFISSEIASAHLFSPPFRLTKRCAPSHKKCYNRADAVISLTYGYLCRRPARHTTQRVSSCPTIARN
jgi:hypothetical protein